VPDISVRSAASWKAAYLLRSALARADFRSDSIQSILPDARGWIDRGEIAPVIRRLKGKSPLTTLVRLFVAGLPCALPEAREALGDSCLEGLATAEMLTLSQQEAFPRITLEWFDNLLIASDLRAEASHPDYVMGPSAPGAALAGVTVRNQVGLAVDLGCGSGLQGLLAACHSERVLAYDINPRAVFFTRFNAALNDVSNIDARESDLFAMQPQGNAGLVVANPPYVISPGLMHRYRDSGRPGDEVCRHLARLIPAMLESGGTGQFTANWIVSRRECWTDRVAGWFSGSGCDVCVLHETTEEISSYVANWLRETDAASLRGEGHEYQRWLSYLEELDIIGVGYGLVSMQRRSDGAESVWIDDAPDDYTFPCSTEVAALLARQAAIGRVPTADLCARAWRPAEDLALEEVKLLNSGHWVTVRREAAMMRGLRWRSALSPALAHVVEQCDGARTLDEITEALENPASVMVAVRCLIDRGMLAPA
jgi:hypothetical protein